MRVVGVEPKQLCKETQTEENAIENGWAVQMNQRQSENETAVRDRREKYRKRNREK